MTTHATAGTARPVISTIPARLDRLRWSPFHTRMVIGLGTAWILDGLEITVASSVTSLLTHSDTLALTTSEVSSLATVYLVGQVVGALVFGKLSDSLGRRRLFMWTLAIYLVGTGLSAAAWPGTAGLIYLYLTRFVAGSGIGGEYAAINSAIDEMMPARYRGRTDIWINGSYWAGSVVGTFASFLLINAFGPTPAGGWPSWSAPCSPSSYCSFGATCRRARGGCSPTAARTRRSRRWRRSSSPHATTGNTWLRSTPGTRSPCYRRRTTGT